MEDEYNEFIPIGNLGGKTLAFVSLGWDISAYACDFCMFYFSSAGGYTQGLGLARQALHNWAKSSTRIF